jgi:hypothetical protein
VECSLEFSHREELIVAYGAGTLHAGITAWFEGHMERCADCQREAALQKAVWLIMDQCKGMVEARAARSAC